MVFAHKCFNNPNLDLYLTIGNFQIKRLHSAKFLGVTIDDALDWKPHIQDLCLCLRRYIGIFYKLSLKLPPSILKILYFAMIYPKLLYGIEIYANTYACNLHNLLILNNRILRILQHQNYRTLIPDLYAAYNTLPVDKLFKFQMLVHAHSVFFHPTKLPNFFATDNLLNIDIHDHNTRSNLSFHRTAAVSSYYSKTSCQLIAKFWNLLPLNIRSTNSLAAFKRLVKTYLTVN